MGRQPTVSNEELVRLYLFEGLSTHGVAQQCGLTQGTVHERIQKLGIGRTKSESLKLAFKMGHKERTGGRPSKCEGDKYLQGNYLQIYSPNHPYSNRLISCAMPSLSCAMSSHGALSGVDGGGGLCISPFMTITNSFLNPERLENASGNL